jgi:hypothetical protein
MDDETGSAQIYILFAFHWRPHSHRRITCLLCSLVIERPRLYKRLLLLYPDLGNECNRGALTYSLMMDCRRCENYNGCKLRDNQDKLPYYCEHCLKIFTFSYVDDLKYQAAAQPMYTDTLSTETTIASRNQEHGVKPSLTFAASPMTPSTANTKPKNQQTPPTQPDRPTLAFTFSRSSQLLTMDIHLLV